MGILRELYVLFFLMYCYGISDYESHLMNDCKWNPLQFRKDSPKELMDLWSRRRFLRYLWIVSMMVAALLLPGIDLDTGSRKKLKNPD